MHTLNHNNDLFICLKYKSSTRHHSIQHLISTTGIASYCRFPILHNMECAKHCRFLFTKAKPLAEIKHELFSPMVKIWILSERGQIFSRFLAKLKTNFKQSVYVIIFFEIFSHFLQLLNTAFSFIFSLIIHYRSSCISSNHAFKAHKPGSSHRAAQAHLSCPIWYS